MQNPFVSRLCLLCALGLVLLHVTPSSRAERPNEFKLVDGDRVVFYGDSITNQRHYTVFVETYALTRFPTRDIVFVHSGWGGDRVSGGTSGGDIDTRLERDVFAYQPTVMTVMLGMNDGRYQPFDQERFETYRDGMTAIVHKAVQRYPQIRLTLLRPSPYDEVTRGLSDKVPEGYNPVLIRFGEAVQQIAEENHQQVIDLNAPMVALLNKAMTINPRLAEKIIPDRIHPRYAGHLALAAELLGGWHAPALVSAVEIDATKHEFVQTSNTQATDLRFASGIISWTQIDAALPMPVEREDPETALVLRCIDFDRRLNQQTLRVTGLASGPFQLRIDGQDIGDFNAAQLAQGINLAELKTPMTKQAEEVYELTQKRTALLQTRRASFHVPYTDAGQPIKASLNRVMEGLVEAAEGAREIQRQTALPVPRSYELLAR